MFSVSFLLMKKWVSNLVMKYGARRFMTIFILSGLKSMALMYLTIFYITVLLSIWPVFSYSMAI